MVIKFTLDQTIGAAFNITLFVASIGILKGSSYDQIMAALRKVRKFYFIQRRLISTLLIALWLGFVADVCGRRKGLASSFPNQFCVCAGGAPGHFWRVGGRRLGSVSEFEGQVGR